jgi:CRISPR-associated endonuclease Csn1
MSERFINWLRYDFDADGKPDFERFGYSKNESYYIFRALIVDESKRGIFKKNPQIIGRVLYQIVQRRGYNDNTDLDENEKNELSKTIMKGGGEVNATGADEIEPYIQNYKTLGAALYHIQKEKKVRIRKRYNLRSRYEAELKEICKIQEIEYLYKRIWTAIIWQRPLRSQKGLVGVCTFENNKRRSPISHPLYEEYQAWVFINNLRIKPIEESVANKSITEILTNIVYPEFYKAAADFKLSSIASKIKKEGFYISAKFPGDTKVKSLSFLYRIKEIFGEDWKEVLDWRNIIENNPKSSQHKYNAEDLWHVHFVKTANKANSVSAFDFTKRFAIEKLALDEDKAEKFAKIRLEQGYATLSLNAIKKILPYLQKGFIYSEAVYLANLTKVLNVEKIDKATIEYFSEEVKKIIKEFNLEKKYTQVVNELINDQLNGDNRFGMDSAYRLDEDDNKDIIIKLNDVFGKHTWESLSEDEKSFTTNKVSEKYLAFLQKKIHSKNIFEKSDRLHDKIFNWLKDTYSLPKERIKYLWHPSEQETYALAKEIDGIKYLGSPEPISKGFKNPMALKTLHRLKQLINFLLQEGKIDGDTRIVIEIARELNDANKREAIKRWQNVREKQNANYLTQIKEHYGDNYNKMAPSDTKNLVDKLRLWEEQKRRCIYTGKTIEISEVLNGSKYDYEHTIPASMSFDNELKNLTIADKTFNQQIKGKRLPTECPNYECEYVYNGLTFQPIVKTLQVIFGKMVEGLDKKGNKTENFQFEKIIELENDYNILTRRKSDDKKKMNNIIVDRHLKKMELDYWRYKLQTFTTKEYKAGWRNSQLRDTQTITKYSLPYLKTVFKKVEVQKGSTTASFRKIYNIQPRLENKERSKHSHHAIDAAVLTLIPQAAKRDKVLLKYNEAIDKNLSYHEYPINWKNFAARYILEIEDDVLINYLPTHRTLTLTYKKVRKRGRIQYVKEKGVNEKWQFKLNDKGEKIQMIAKGDSIRGQLHKLSNFGAIKNQGDIILVERYPISTFTSISDCKHIVDNKVRELVHNELSRRMESGLSFEKAKLDPIRFHKGNEVIKKVRCKVAAGRGYLTTEKAIQIGKHNFISKHNYKQSVYVQNEENTYCLYYEKNIDSKILRAFQIVGLFEISQLKIKSEKQIKQENYYNKITVGKGKNAVELPLLNIIKVGTKCIFFKENIEELKELSKTQLLRRIFKVYKFNDIGVTKYIYLQNHLEARKNDELGNGDGIFNETIFQSRLMLNPDKFTCAIEGFHFQLNIDGEIQWK